MHFIEVCSILQHACLGDCEHSLLIASAFLCSALSSHPWSVYLWPLRKWCTFAVSWPKQSWSASSWIRSSMQLSWRARYSPESPHHPHLTLIGSAIYIYNIYTVCLSLIRFASHVKRPSFPYLDNGPHGASSASGKCARHVSVRSVFFFPFIIIMSSSIRMTSLPVYDAFFSFLLDGYSHRTFWAHSCVHTESQSPHPNAEQSLGGHHKVSIIPS